MRARQPDCTGYALNRGVRIYYEVHGTGRIHILLVPPWTVTHSSQWKMQVPFLARHHTAIVYDPRGNGRSDRPVSGYSADDVVADAVAVLDELAIDRCVLLTVSGGARACCFLAARHPDRISAIAIISASLYSGQRPATPEEAESRKQALVDSFDKRNRAFWARNFLEAHSTKAQDDGYEWTHESTPALVAAAQEGLWYSDARAVLDKVRCSVLLIHGLREDDHIETFEARRGLPQSRLVTIISPGHMPNVRDPVRVNLVLREFLAQVASEEGQYARARA